MRLEGLVSWYESLSPETLERLTNYYHEDATFHDPFNHVKGHAAIIRIFEHMFENTTNPTFHVTHSDVGNDWSWLRWEFHFQLGRKHCTVEGASHLLFGPDGRVSQHRDYWDAADLFAQAPLIGGFSRWLKRKLSADTESKDSI
ncbi:MAG: nuclear transport factor 2 family protein [Gammaproteobacteria bacterium]|nr:nuclear transport factor 2 family protein [Gammaproteobacteria bacterium]